MNTLKTLESPMGAEILVDGRCYLNFAGSCYLGLSGVREILEAGSRTLRTTGAGYQLSRHFGLVSAALQDVEREGARFFGTEAAFYLATGYHFGFAAIAAWRTRFTQVLFDELAHYCLREAIVASNLVSHPFRHLDAAHLGELLARHCRASDVPLVVTDGMYSTCGEIAPLDEFARVLEPYGGRLLVDESHSFGVLGAHGRGASEHHVITGSGPLIGGSLSKAFGAVGALIPAHASDIEALLATPVSRGAAVGLPAAAAMCAESLRYARTHPELLQRLRDNTAYLKAGLRQLGLAVGSSVAPVAAFTLPSKQAMTTLQERLLAEDIFILHSDYIGAGPDGILRCGIFADHTRAHFDRLLDALRRYL